MMLNNVTRVIGTLALAAGTVLSLPAAEEPSPVPATPQPSREELREQLKNLTPAEREAKLKEFREKYAVGGPERAIMEKRREELKNLPAEEREAKIREWRLQGSTNAAAVRNITAEEREARRKQMRARLDAQLELLREKKAKGALSADEQKRLERMEEIAKRLDQGGAPAVAQPVPQAPAPAQAPDKDAPGVK